MQTYVFSHSISIIEKLSGVFFAAVSIYCLSEMLLSHIIVLISIIVDLDSTTHERSEEVQNTSGQTVNSLTSHCEHLNVGDGSRVQAQGAVYTQQQKPSEDSGSYSDKSGQKYISLSTECINRIEGDDLQTSSQPIIGAASDPTLPAEVINIYL